jgi:hypothetical protein
MAPSLVDKKEISALPFEKISPFMSGNPSTNPYKNELSTLAMSISKTSQPTWEIQLDATDT